MRFLLTGIETNNKGAELMLYAILQEIEKRHPNSTIYIEKKYVRQGRSYIKSNLRIIILDSVWAKIHRIFHIYGIFKRLHLPQLPTTFNIPMVDCLIDGSGLHFTDQMKSDIIICQWEIIFKSIKQNNGKIIFLPQGFGPIETPKVQTAIRLLSDNANLVCAREKVSYNYLDNCGCMNMNKVAVYTDFTSLVDGVIPPVYEHLINCVCIIPNVQMINKNVVTQENYICYIQQIVDKIREVGYKVYMLNHEGKNDERFMNLCKERIGNKIEYVSGLNALETKGLISTAYLVITSRFHGLASALNSCVPSLATSWSHKYRCLFKDFQQKDGILSIMDIDSDMIKIMDYLNPTNNKLIRQELQKVSPIIKAQSCEMWRKVWSIIK